MSDIGRMTMHGLTVVLAEHGCRAFCLQWFEGKWRASIRKRDGIFAIADHDTMLGAVGGLVERLGKPR